MRTEGSWVASEPAESVPLVAVQLTAEVNPGRCCLEPTSVEQE